MADFEYEVCHGRQYAPPSSRTDPPGSGTLPVENGRLVPKVRQRADTVAAIEPARRLRMAVRARRKSRTYTAHIVRVCVVRYVIPHPLCN